MTDRILCIDKPLGMSSMAAISKIRKTLKSGRIGHSGTLDPAASGLLVAATGNATRLFQYLELEPKVYRFGIVFGSSTDTLDTEGTVTDTGGSVPSIEALESVLADFSGEIIQQPPAFSALKVKGERAYALARRNQEFELPVRKVTVFSISLEKFDNVRAEATMLVSCSAGTYVRSLARDIALRLGTFGYAGFIRRITMGRLSVEKAVKPECGADELKNAMLKPADCLSAGMRYAASDCELQEISFGRNITINSSDGGEIVYVLNQSSELFAVLKKTGPGVYHPEKVFLSPMAAR